jgi:hypothetical protein
VSFKKSATKISSLLSVQKECVKAVTAYPASEVSMLHECNRLCTSIVSQFEATERIVAVGRCKLMNPVVAP